MSETAYLEWPLFRRSVVAAFRRSLTPELNSLATLDCLEPLSLTPRDRVDTIGTRMLSMKPVVQREARVWCSFVDMVDRLYPDAVR